MNGIVELPHLSRDLLNTIRNDSLSKHDGYTRKYGSLPVDSCTTVIVNRTHDVNIVQVVFEEFDGTGHGVNVPSDWILEEHISPDRVTCPRCGGGGKLTMLGVDCTECQGTGKVPGKLRLM